MWLSLISWSICIDKLKLLTKQYIYNYMYLKVYFFFKSIPNLQKYIH